MRLYEVHEEKAMTLANRFMATTGKSALKKHSVNYEIATNLVTKHMEDLLNNFPEI